MARRPILVESVFGVYDPDSLRRLKGEKPTVGPFGLYTGQIRVHSVLLKAGWFNRYGVWLGWGDLDTNDFIRISNEIPEDELFVVLTEFDAWSNNTDGLIRAMLPGGRPMAWPEYVADRCAFIVGKGHVYLVGEVYPFDLPVEILTRDDAFLKIMGRTPQENRQLYEWLRDFGGFTRITGHSYSRMTGERAEDRSGMISGGLHRSSVSDTYRALQGLDIHTLIKAIKDQALDTTVEYSMVSWFDEQDVADAELLANVGMEYTAEVTIQIVDPEAEQLTVRVTKKAVL